MASPGSAKSPLRDSDAPITSGAPESPAEPLDAHPVTMSPATTPAIHNGHKRLRFVMRIPSRALLRSYPVRCWAMALCLRIINAVKPYHLNASYGSDNE